MNQENCFEDLPERDDQPARFDDAAAKSCRSQVDLLFSDENLIKDSVLLGKMRGRKNSPVPASFILQMAGMDGFRPLLAVIEACRVCKMVEVLETGGVAYFQRKTPFKKNEVVGAAPSASKTKKRNKPTGFEENWADGPLTPLEYAQEQDMYDLSVPIVERIEIAIQQYQAKRRFSSKLKNIFDKWMKFGGIDTTAKQFSGGLNSEFLEDADHADIAAAKASAYIEHVRRHNGDKLKCKVDFAVVVKGFLSTVLPDILGDLGQGEIKECTNLIRNFLNYILHHNVCPEFKENILDAKNICDEAEKELLATYRLSILWPGTFNKSCSKVFGGTFASVLQEGHEWFSPEPGYDHTQSVLNDTTAKKVIAAAIVAYPNIRPANASNSAPNKGIFDDPIVLTTRNVGLEVTKIEPASPKVAEFYEEFFVNSSIEKLAVLKCKPWLIPKAEEDDLPSSRVQVTEPDYTFLLEASLIRECFVGMKLKVTMQKLASGLVFFDMVDRVYCSFHELLDNDLLLHWRPPHYYTRDEILARNDNGSGENAFGNDNESEGSDFD